jgi:hypothetical protein
MAYRGDQTDPLEIMIQRQRAMRRIILLLLVLWIVPMFARLDFSAITHNFTTPLPATSDPAPAAPRPFPVPGTKMSAQSLERLLRTSPASNPPPRDVRCLPDRTWDYVCTYRIDSPRPQPRLRIGVRVSSDAIVQASAPHSLATPLPKP